MLLVDFVGLMASDEGFRSDLGVAELPLLGCPEMDTSLSKPIHPR